MEPEHDNHQHAERALTQLLLRTLPPLAALAWLAWPQLRYLQEIWLDDGTYSHGLLLLAVCLWLLWQQRHSLVALPDQPSRLMLLPLALIALALALSQAVGIDLLARVLLLPLLATLSAALYGLPRTRHLLFPLALLSLALPLWGLLIPALQALAVLVVGQALDVVAIPAAIHDTYIRIPAGDFEVAQGCSGLRYLLVAAAITALWGHLYMDNWRHRLLYLGAGIAAALVTNWIRIFALIWVGHSSNMESPLMADHNNFGWYIFAAMLPPLFWLGRRFPEAQAQIPPAAATSDHNATAQALLVSALACATLLLPQAMQRDAASALPTIRLPLAPTGWQMSAPPANGWQPHYVGSNRAWQLQYRQGDNSLRLHLQLWTHQDNDTDLGQTGNTLAPDPWQPEERLADPCPRQAHCQRLRRGDDTHVIIAWQIINGTPVLSRLGIKRQQLLGTLSGRTDAALIALEKRCDDDCASALEALWHEGQPMVIDVLEQLDVEAQP